MSDELLCSFCGKRKEEVRVLIVGPGPMICDECILLCMEVIVESAADAGKEIKRLRSN